ncbi:MAG TPA: hypothetical protein VMT69_02075 [Kineosporiaceae bacterium]|nr:hypothetical protein [Kineosporiaceae bacterium]
MPTATMSGGTTTWTTWARTAAASPWTVGIAADAATLGRRLRAVALAVRDRQDPHRVFATPRTGRLLGP